MGRTQAQALAQRTKAITHQESMILVKCLLRVSVYHVCWMRGLFPEASFTGHDLAQLENLHVKMLEPSGAGQEEDEEAAMLKNWLEQGVLHAVERRHLKSMYFGIAEDAAGTRLLEEYIYSFNYGPDGSITFEVDAHAAGAGNKRDRYASRGGKDKEGRRPGVDDVRYQVVRLMRMLVQVCATLDKVPDERYLFIKLTYHDDTPSDYEPPYFHALDEAGIGHFERRPFSMEVGAMDTAHHMVSLRVKSVLDSCDDAPDRPDAEDMAELQASQQMPGAADDGDAAMEDALTEEQQQQQQEPEPEQAAGGAARAAAAAKLRTEEALALLAASEDQMMQLEAADAAAPAACGPQPQQQQQQQQPAGASSGGSFSHGGAAGSGAQGLDPRSAVGSPGGGGAGGEPYEAVRAYCVGRGRVSFIDLLGRFFDVPSSQLQRAFDGLHREGLLQPGPDKDTFLVVQPGAAAAAPAAASEGCMAEAGSGGQAHASDSDRAAFDAAQTEHMLSKMTGLSVGGAPGEAAAARGGSAVGRATHAGSLATGNQPGAPTAAMPQVNPAAAEGEPSVQQQCRQAGTGPWFEASQHSDAAAVAAAGAAPGAGAPAAGAGAAGGGRQQGSRLRKASYVDAPIYQHAGKRSSRAASGAGEAGGQQQAARGLGVSHQAVPTKKKGGRKADAKAAAAAAAAAPAAGSGARTPARTPTRGRGRLAAMKSS